MRVVRTLQQSALDQPEKERFRAGRVEPEVFAQLFNGDPRFLA